MRFVKGTKVEVLTRKEVPSGSWRCAEIIGVNGRSYTVRYYRGIELFGKAKVEKVSWKVIRPSPPPVDLLQKWVAGDVMEVFHNFSWKMATILKVSGCNHVVVRLLGSAIEFTASKFYVRARLSWQDGEWIMIGKGAHECDDPGFRIPTSHHDDNQLLKIDTFVSGDDEGFHVSTKKRKLSHYHSRIEACVGPHKLNKMGKRESSWNQLNMIQQTQLPEKVDNVVSSQAVLNEKCMHRTLNNKTNGYSDMILERANTNAAAGYSRSISLETDGGGSFASSVASCSVNKSSCHKLHRLFTAGTERGACAPSSVPTEILRSAFSIWCGICYLHQIHRVKSL